MLKMLPGGGNVGNTIDGLEEDGVGEPDLRDPEGTNHVCPPAVVGLLKCTALEIIGLVQPILISVCVFEYI